jgi:hypothetical protein
MSRSSRPEQLLGLLERAGLEVPTDEQEPAAVAAGLRIAEG